MDTKLSLDKLVERSEGTGKSNYIAWRFKLNLLLRTKGLFEIATGVVVRPEETNNNHADWVKKDLEAQAIIGLNVDERIALKICMCTSALKMIERLETLYGDKSQISKDGLRMKFFTYAYDSKKSMIENCLEIDGLAQELRAAKEEIKDEWIITRILNMLPENYSHFYSAWESTPEIDKILSKLIERLQHEELQQERIRNGGSHNVENALVSKGKFKQNKNKNKGQSVHNKQSKDKNESSDKIKCYKCGEIGHKKTECTGKPCKEYIEYCKKNYKCNICNETGHFAKECTKQAKSYISVDLSLAALSQKSSDADTWYKDSGATHHMTGNLSLMSNLKPLSKQIFVTIGDRSELIAKSKGDVHLLAYDGKVWNPIVLRDVLFVQNLNFNLFSLTTVLDKGLTQQADAKRSVILENGKPVLIAEREGGLFKMKMREKSVYGLAAVSIKTWHERLAHQNVKYVRDILKKNNIKYIDDWNGHVCEGCAYGKQCKVSHHINPVTAEKCLDLIHVDLGEMNELSLGGAKYFLIFKDDYSHFRTVYFLKQKSDAVQKLEIYLNLVENQFGRNVKMLKSDNGTEIKNVRSKDIFERLGIFHQRSAAYTPEQNGRAEREMRTIVEAARAGIYAKELGLKLWAEALGYSVFTINQTGTSSVKGMSPADLWFGRRVDVNKMKPFGCECFTLIPDCQRQKLDKKSNKGIFVGYDVEELGYRVYIPEKRHVVISCNVLFREEFFSNEGMIEVNLGMNKNETRDEGRQQSFTKEKEMDLEGQEENQTESESENYETPDNSQIQSEEEEEEEEEEPEEDNTNLGRQLRDRRKIQPHPKFNDYICFVGMIEDISVDEALNDVNWKSAMTEEINSLRKMKTWELTELPKGRKALNCKWVLCEKNDGRMKARLVACGYDQEYGVDYHETFAPVACNASIRLLISQAVKKGFYIKTFDIKTAFLNGKLSEEVYMNQPKGFVEDSTKVCKLLRSIYGLKQASNDWYREFTNYLQSINFETTDDDPCLFYNKKKTVFIGIVVDDGLVVGNKLEINELLFNLSKRFEITFQDPSKGKLHYLGMDIHLLDNGIFINQEQYTKKIIRQFGYENAYEVSTPIEPGMISDKFEDDQMLKDKPYREAIGSLLYLSTTSRPDISYAVNYLSRQVSKPKVSHWKMIGRVFRYLQGTINHGIFFDGKGDLKVYTDSNFGDDEVGCSVSGVLVENGGPIVWYAQKQKTTSLATSEAELRAAVAGIQEIAWIRRVVEELGFGDVSTPTDLMVDNQASIRMLINGKEGKITKGKKHIEIKRKFICEHVGKTVNPIYVKSRDQVADIFTKALGRKSFLDLRKKLLKEECWF